MRYSSTVTRRSLRGQTSTITLQRNVYFSPAFALFTHISPQQASLPFFFPSEDDGRRRHGLAIAPERCFIAGLALQALSRPCFSRPPHQERRKYTPGLDSHWKLITINTPRIFMLLLFSSVQGWFQSTDSEDTVCFVKGERTLGAVSYLMDCMLFTANLITLITKKNGHIRKAGKNKY